MRMTAIHNYLIENCRFTDTGKHAVDFCKLMFTANLRGLYCWRKEDLNNKRKDMHYDVIMSLPDVVRTWICEERARHIPYFSMKPGSRKRKSKRSRYNATEWMRRFRKLFTLATAELFKKQKKV